MKLFDLFAELLYPPRCIVCDEPIFSEGYCRRCKNMIETIPYETCFCCGLEPKNCECKRFIYHFDGFSSPFYNKDYAQQAVYNLKFNEKFSCVNTFADEMANRAAKVFGIENIDVVCCVPLSKSSLLYRGFNQSELFAVRISEKLNKKFKPGLLYKKPSVKTQHDIRTIRDRFFNVRGGFGVSENIKGKNVLLVDDIKTTGASLDECARQLKFSGADKVYCVTALVSVREEHKSKTNDLK